MTQLAPDQLPQGWSDIATVYERAFEKLTKQFSYEALKQVDLKEGEDVLDVAAGTGSFSMLAARAGGNVVATDFAPGMVGRLQERIASENLENIRAQVMDGQNLDYEDGCYDVSASVVGVIFFPDIEKGISELRRVLRPGGRCAIVCWSDPEKFEMMGFLKKSIEIAAPDFEMPTQTPVWARLLGDQQLTEAMKLAGFENVRVTTMTGKLEIEAPETYWDDFTCSAPPLAKLFEALGDEKTRKIGEVFTELLVEKCNQGAPYMTSEACIGIGEV